MSRPRARQGAVIKFHLMQPRNDWQNDVLCPIRFTFQAILMETIDHVEFDPDWWSLTPADVFDGSRLSAHSSLQGCWYHHELQETDQTMHWTCSWRQKGEKHLLTAVILQWLPACESSDDCHTPTQWKPLSRKVLQHLCYTSCYWNILWIICWRKW